MNAYEIRNLSYDATVAREWLENAQSLRDLREAHSDVLRHFGEVYEELNLGGLYRKMKIELIEKLNKHIRACLEPEVVA